MIKYNIDRIDLQYKNIIHNQYTETMLIEKNNFKFCINKQENVNHYIYNVNPSIWKISTLMEVMSNFKNDTYRTIEEAKTQEFCKKYRIFKLYWESYINCGDFGCIPFFQFIHITHGGKLLPLTRNNLNKTLVDTYMKILEQFSLAEKREFGVRNFSDYYHGPSLER